MYKKTFIERVNEYAELKDLKKAKGGISAVFYALSARLTIKEGEDLRAQLPEDLKCMWDEVKETKVDVIKFHKGEFLEKIRDDGKLRDIEEAEKVTLAVFKTLKEQISEGEANHIKAQLPKRLKDMWTDA